mmetsp:Transcript_80661/g.246582  ORF Transcript_80661/g.246582 Transcript_80661/m.246582 type:complete len:202 (+) Transcript_80661:327-932(+)
MRLRMTSGVRLMPSKWPPSSKNWCTWAEKPPMAFSSTVRSTLCSVASKLTSFSSRGFTQRASATVADTPYFSSSAAAARHSRRRPPTDRIASVLSRPSRDMRPLPGSKKRGSAGNSKSPYADARGYRSAVGMSSIFANVWTMWTSSASSAEAQINMSGMQAMNERSNVPPCVGPSSPTKPARSRMKRTGSCWRATSCTSWS